MSDQDQAEMTLSQLNESEALRALDGQKQLLIELANIFLEDAPKIMSEMDQATAQGDWQAARRSAHSLKGLASTFYATRMVEAAAAAETYFATSDPKQVEAAELEKLRNAMTDLTKDLRLYLSHSISE